MLLVTELQLKPASMSRESHGNSWLRARLTEPKTVASRKLLTHLFPSWACPGTRGKFIVTSNSLF